jgi:UDP-3-O-[3-hydroxymyristoyl] glucosamine N-acyltransferase
VRKISVFLPVLLVCLVIGFGGSRLWDHSAALAQGPATAYAPHPAAGKPGITIDPTAFVHPSVILEGTVNIGPYAYIDAGSILTGNVTVGHHSLIRCNVTIRGRVRIGNYTHIYDNVNIEGGRPAKPVGGLGAACDYNTHIGKNAVLADGSATRVNMEICDGCFFEGVPAVRKRRGLTEKDRAEYFGVSPLAWTTYEGDRQEANAKKRLGE